VDGVHAAGERREAPVEPGAPVAVEREGDAGEYPRVRQRRLPAQVCLDEDHPGTRWSRAGRLPTTRPWPATGRPGANAGHSRWAGPSWRRPGQTTPASIRRIHSNVRSASQALPAVEPARLPPDPRAGTCLSRALRPHALLRRRTTRPTGGPRRGRPPSTAGEQPPGRRQPTRGAWRVDAVDRLHRGANSGRPISFPLQVFSTRTHARQALP
jgi:hypothetical protein